MPQSLGLYEINDENPHDDGLAYEMHICPFSEPPIFRSATIIHRLSVRTSSANILKFKAWLFAYPLYVESIPSFIMDSYNTHQNTRTDMKSEVVSVVDAMDANSTRAVLSVSELFDRIVHFSTPVTAARLASVNRISHDRVLDFNRRYYDLDAGLRRFVQRPLRLRELLGETGSCISGSFALQFMGGYFWPQSDLDVYTPRYRSKAICNFLIEEGFQYKPREKQYASLSRELIEPEHNVPFICPQILLGATGRMRGVENVYTFHRCTTQGSDLVVQVIEARDSPMNVILSFHSSEFLVPHCKHHS